MKSRNLVLEGEYKGWKIYYRWNSLLLMEGLFGKQYQELNKKQIIKYEVINKDSYISSSSAIAKSTLGSFFLGTPGMMAGLGAKTNDVYWIAIEWIDHTKSLIEMDSGLYRTLIRILF